MSTVETRPPTAPTEAPPPPDRRPTVSAPPAGDQLPFRRAIALVIAAVALSAAVTLLLRSDPVTVSDGTAAPSAPEVEAQPVPGNVADVARPATDLPAPVEARGPATVTVDLETVELDGWLADGTAFRYWTFNGQVPGPMIRVQQGDTVELSLTNNADSSNPHSIDLHAVTGPGGGAVGTHVGSGETKTISFQALNPGVYVYHCATPHIPSHVAMGMYGLIIVEPEGGLPPVDREFYVMQGEVYTAQQHGTEGLLTFDGQRMLDENASYVVFNGASGSLTGEQQLTAEVGETVRFFVGNGGPNLTSSFHIIGEILDRVHPEGASEFVSNVQTTAVPPGGATMIELDVEVPGDYILVDHALSRALDKGAVGILHVTGPENPDIFHAPDAVEGSGH